MDVIYYLSQDSVIEEEEEVPLPFLSKDLTRARRRSPSSELIPLQINFIL